jgi:FkbM family methyltransferase
MIKTLALLKSRLIYECNPFKNKRKINFFKSIISNSDLVFDVGAHVGDRTDTWVKLNAQVVAIDPQPVFFKYLKNKYKNIGNVHVENIALSDHSGSLLMYISDNNPTVSSISDVEWRNKMTIAAKKQVYNRSIEVEVDTLDYLIDKYGIPRFIKIDVEGHELEVLKGLSHKVDYLSFEFLTFDIEGLKLCLDRLEELGYSLYNWSFVEEFKFIHSEWCDSETILESIKNYKKGVFSGDIYVKRT